MTSCIDMARPRYADAEVVVAAPEAAPGNWAGAPSCVLVDGVFWLTYRVRRPLHAGRGMNVVVARSTDGVSFTTVCEVSRHLFGAASFERPVIVPTDSGWRLYLSCATPDSKHWWIEALDADTPEQLPHGHRQVVLPGDAAWAVKDPVVLRRDGSWHLWVCAHPLTERGQEDRMVTRYAISSDGLSWQDQGPVLFGTAGRWDSRGARVTAVLGFDPLTVLYDGRASAAANWFETTGLAKETDGRLQAVGDRPIAVSPESDGALRYVSAVPLGDRRTRFYFEAARRDGSHALMTSLG